MWSWNRLYKKLRNVSFFWWWKTFQHPVRNVWIVLSRFEMGVKFDTCNIITVYKMWWKRSLEDFVHYFLLNWRKCKCHLSLLHLLGMLSVNIDQLNVQYGCHPEILATNPVSTSVNQRVYEAVTLFAYWFFLERVW